MQEQLWFTELLNHAFAGPVNAAMQALPAAFHPANPHAPITNAVAMQVLVVALLLLFFVVVRLRLSVEKPRGLQHVVEMFNEFAVGQSENVIGEQSSRFIPFLSALFLLILFGNLIGLIPSLESPTATGATPLGCALVAFVYYNVHGLREQGVLGYLKQFLGPIWWLIPLMFVIEIISHLARVMSLSIRLYANIFSGDMITMAFFSIVPLVIPVIFLLLHVAVSLLQAYIFMLLNAIYIGLAVSHEH